MRWSHWQDALLCLWPGLRNLWRHGHIRGLIAAVLFAAFLQMALLTCLIWPDLVGSSTRAVVCFSGLVFWAAFTIPEVSKSALFRRASLQSIDREHLFQSAQREYLKGNWFQVETLLEKLLELDPEDADARLYLATMKRRIGRIDEARTELNKLESISAARRWKWELCQERKLLKHPTVGPNMEMAGSSNAADTAESIDAA